MNTFLNALGRFAPVKAVLLIALMLSSSFLEGFGLLLLIPLLAVAGMTGLDSSGGVMQALAKHLSASHWQFSLNDVLVLYVLLVSAVACLSYAKTMAATHLRLSFCEALRNRVFSALLKANWPFLMRQKQSDLCHTLTTDVMRLSSAIHFMVLLATNVCMIVIYTALSFALSWQLTIASLVFGAAIMLSCRYLTRRSYRVGKRLHRDSQSLYSRVFDHLNSLKVAKASGLEKRYLQGFESINHSIRDAQAKYTQASALTTISYRILSVAFLALGFAVAYQVWHMPLASLLLLLVVFARLLPQLNQAQSQWQQVVALSPAFESLNQLEQSAQAQQEKTSQTALPLMKHSLVLSNCAFRYPDSEAWVLKDLNCSVQAGERLAIVGASGAGKTSLIDVLAGLFMPESGELLLDGEKITAERLAVWRQQVAYFTQDTFLFDGSIADNLRLVLPKATDDQLWEALAKADAADFVAQYPAGLNHPVGDKGSALSGGQAQRICLARTLLSQPRLLILDEATSQIDAQSERQIAQALSQLDRSVTLILVTHREALLNVADRVLRLENGRLAENEQMTKTVEESLNVLYLSQQGIVL